MESSGSLGHSSWRPSQSTLAVLPLLLIFFAETVVAYTVYPFIAKFIGNLDVVHGDKENVGYYLGILEFVPNVISAIVVLQWGRFGDRHGRKPVLLINMGGLAIAIVCLGLSKTFTALVLSKAIEGFFKASRPTVKAAVAESSDESHMAFVFSLLPIMHAGGAVIGPLIGGTLADPAERFPSLFRSSFWTTFPYLLPTLMSGMLCLCSLCVAAIFFKETLPLVGDHNQPLIITADGADDIAPLLGHAHEESQDRATEVAHRESFSKKELRAFLAVLGNYAIFTLLAISFNATFALFLASPTTSGGLSLLPPTAGAIMSLSGGLHAITQACFFTRAHGRWGLHKIYRCATAAFIPTYAAMPVMGMIAKRAGHATPLVWAVLVLQQIACALSVSGFTCIFIFIAKATPSPKMLGRTNGLAQMVHSSMSAIGPAAFTSLTALSIRHNLVGGTLAQLIQASLGFLALGLSFTLP